MKSKLLIVCLMLVFLTGCASTIVGGNKQFPNMAFVQKVELSGNNYKVIKTNAVGRSWGFSLVLGLIPVLDPSYDKAMTDLYQSAGVGEGKAIALINVIQQREDWNMFAFAIPKLVIRADIIEFTK